MLLVMPISAALVAAYPEKPGTPISPAPQDMFTIDPDPCTLMCRSSCFIDSTPPRTLRAIIRSSMSAE
ncbi:hypothetical protein ADK96_37120 [Streptomyces sp. IGB124]|nr:hypothetical protein ADK96_37120 [Streptomyces sp. IGB124]